MLIARAVISAAIVLVGAIIVVEMMRADIRSTFTGIVLGCAMIFYGAYRLRQIRQVRRSK